MIYVTLDSNNFMKDEFLEGEQTLNSIAMPDLIYKAHMRGDAQVYDATNKAWKSFSKTLSAKYTKKGVKH